MVLVGTYHSGDPRHQRMLDRLEAELSGAAALYVEAGPEEEAKLEAAVAAKPDLLVQTEGPPLPERLSDAEWTAVSGAMEARGTPAVITARMRPWFVATMLSLPPCMMESYHSDVPEGLDNLLIARAGEMNLPVLSLEPWETLFSVFADLTPQQEIDLLRGVLPAAELADDYAVTLTDSYFAGDVWEIWEFSRFDAYARSGFSPAEVDAQMLLFRENLMDERNQSWIRPLTRGAVSAAAQDRQIVAAFGALHLPGQEGVLRLLEKDGWTIRRLE